MSPQMFLILTLLVRWCFCQPPASIANIATNNDGVISCSDASPKSATTTSGKTYYLYQFFITVATGTVPLFNTCNSGMDTELFFYDSDGNQFDSKDDGGTCSLRENYTPGVANTRLGIGGTYYVAVSHYGTGTGHFELTMSNCGNALVQTFPTCNVTGIASSISTGKETDYFYFYHCGGTIVISTCSSTVSTVVALYDSSQNYIGYANNGVTDSGSSVACFTNYETWTTSLSAGNYYLGVAGSSITGTGAYEIDISSSCCSAPNPPITCNSEVTGSHQAGEIVLYDFTLTSTLPVTFDSCGNDYDSMLYIYDSNDVELGTADDNVITGSLGTSLRCSCRAVNDFECSEYWSLELSAGDYTLGIGGYATESGNYLVRMDYCDTSVQDGDIRLIGTRNAVPYVPWIDVRDGYIQIIHNNIWGQICDDFVDASAFNNFGIVACDELGCSGSQTKCGPQSSSGYCTGQSHSYESDDGILQIWKDGPTCTGTENRIADCSPTTWTTTGCPTTEPAANVAVECTVCYPTTQPTNQPTPQPTSNPTGNPSTQPTKQPTPQPTSQPTPQPTVNPTINPTPQPTPQPNVDPTPQPTNNPTDNPTSQPTDNPTDNPTPQPTDNPTPQPTPQPTSQPTAQPTNNPTSQPTAQPTNNPTSQPTNNPTQQPTNNPTSQPTPQPTDNPITSSPLTSPPTTHEPSQQPTQDPTIDPTEDPTYDPTIDPTIDPTFDPTFDPTADPTIDPTKDPTIDPTIDPTKDPTTDPSKEPTEQPTVDPTKDPTSDPTKDPTLEPTTDPTYDPTVEPTFDPTNDPTSDPTSDPTEDPTSDPTEDPTIDPTSNPTLAPTASPVRDGELKTTLSATESPEITKSVGADAANSFLDDSNTILLLILGALGILILTCCCFLIIYWRNHRQKRNKNNVKNIQLGQMSPMSSDGDIEGGDGDVTTEPGGTATSNFDFGKKLQRVTSMSSVGSYGDDDDVDDDKDDDGPLPPENDPDTKPITPVPGDGGQSRHGAAQSNSSVQGNQTNMYPNDNIINMISQNVVPMPVPVPIPMSMAANMMMNNAMNNAMMNNAMQMPNLMPLPIPIAPPYSYNNNNNNNNFNNNNDNNDNDNQTKISNEYDTPGGLQPVNSNEYDDGNDGNDNDQPNDGYEYYYDDDDEQDDQMYGKGNQQTAGK